MNSGTDFSWRYIQNEALLNCYPFVKARFVMHYRKWIITLYIAKTSPQIHDSVTFALVPQYCPSLLEPL